MQFHIIGEPSEQISQFSAILDFLGVPYQTEASFSGDQRAAVVLAPPYELPNIEPSNPVLVLGEAPVRITERGLATISQPFRQQDVLLALRAARICAKLNLLEGGSARQERAGVLSHIVGDHPLIDDLREQVVNVALESSPVLLQGEVGTGKRSIAQAIHRCSERSDGPFVPINCGTFPQALLASELFGCERGAIPGAITRRQGRIELAEGGTLLLEDIEALSIQSQASLLSLLKSGELERIGAVRGHSVDVRLITSTTVDLSQLVQRGEFRDDLFYALQGLQLKVPPLRAYREIVPDLLVAFEPTIPTSALTDGARKKLQDYPWPGNLTELRGVARQVAGSSADESIELVDLPDRISGSSVVATANQANPSKPISSPDEPLLPVNGLDLKAYLADLEKRLIAQALDDTGSIVARAADRLHIRRTTLVEKMRKYGLRKG